MNPDVNTPQAEPSAPAAAPERIQYDSWDDKGNPIVSAKTKSPSKQDSAPADAETKESAKPEAKAENAAESGAAKDRQEKPPKKDKPTAEERIAQLEATIERIKREAGQKSDVKPAAEPSAAKPAEAPKELKAPVKPKLADFTGPDPYEKYEEAKDKYFDELTDYKSEVKLRQFRQEQAQAEQQRQFQQQLEEGKKRYADFEEKARPAAKAIIADQEIIPAVKQAVAGSDVLMDLAYVLGGDQAKLEQFIAIAKSDPVKAIKYIGKLEDGIRDEQAKAKVSDKEPDSKKETPVQPQPRAPRPPAEVGGRNTATEDPDKSAARSGDTKAAFAEWDRKAFGR